MDGSLLFPVPGERRDAQRRREEEARSICSRCEVRLDCAAFADKAEERYGVWGGRPRSERRTAARKAPSVPGS
jgi:WhiB family redox-sensing transcriptional regulator